MITRVVTENFKRFERQEFHLDPVTVLAGPNNSGKTTLIQALSAWAFALERWRTGRGAPIIGGHADSIRRPGQPITRKDFTPLPLSHFNLLWNERATNWRNKDRDGDKVAEEMVRRPRPIRIRVEGLPDKGEPWGLTMEFRYQGPEQIYANPSDFHELVDASVLPDVTHCPAFSGIGAEEPRFDPGYRNLRIGEGKPGDVLRNLLLEIASDDDAWNGLAHDISDLFAVRLKKPAYDPAQPFIICEYEERGATYDLASAGSGFHQTLLLFAFIYGRESAVLLVDEPDAHLHVWLQTRVFDRLRALAQDRNRQLVLATHAETILASSDPDQILSFVGPPHRLARRADRDALLTAVRQVSPLDLLLAEQGRAVLYCEGESDRRILEAWAKRLDHPAGKFFRNPFLHPLGGRRTREARHHLFGVRAVHKDIRGLLLVDADGGEDLHDLSADGLDIHVWRRYEIENYLLVPAAVARFLSGGEENDLFVRNAFMEELPASVLTDPLRDIEAVIRIPASKTIMPKLFDNTQLPLRKADYYRIAEAMKPEEIHPEVIQVLDKIAALLPESGGGAA
ncbi:MAG: AAA family ATPase [Alphaproteobacteria bacterium]|nr:AAA family ATPase [Alphaproteobacteria bacterium]